VTYPYNEAVISESRKIYRLKRLGAQLETYLYAIMAKATSSTSFSDSVLTGATLMLGFCLIAPLLDVAAKLASSSVPVAQISAVHFIVQCTLMAPFIWFMGLSL